MALVCFGVEKVETLLELSYLYENKCTDFLLKKKKKVGGYWKLGSVFFFFFIRAEEDSISHEAQK